MPSAPKNARTYSVRFMPVNDGDGVEWGTTEYGNLGSQSASKLVGVLPAVYGPRGGLKVPVRLVFLIPLDSKRTPRKVRRSSS